MLKAFSHCSRADQAVSLGALSRPSKKNGAGTFVAATMFRARPGLTNPAEGSFLHPRKKTLHLMSRRSGHMRVCVDVQIWICCL